MVSVLGPLLNGWDCSVGVLQLCEGGRLVHATQQIYSCDARLNYSSLAVGTVG
jgi:hypothetical protein